MHAKILQSLLIIRNTWDYYWGKNCILFMIEINTSIWDDRNTECFREEAVTCCQLEGTQMIDRNLTDLRR